MAQNTGEVIGLTASDSANPDALVSIDPDSGVFTDLIPLVMPDGESAPSCIDMFFLGSSTQQSRILSVSALTPSDGSPLTDIQ